MSDGRLCMYDQAPDTLDRSRYEGCTRKKGHRGPCAHPYSESVMREHSEHFDRFYGLPRPAAAPLVSDETPTEVDRREWAQYKPSVETPRRIDGLGSEEMSRTFRFEFPMPPSLNKDYPTWKRIKEKKQYYKQLDELQLTKRLPAPPPLPLLRVIATVSMFVHNKMDNDNSSTRCKWPQDWLKTRGYITDDRTPFLTLLAQPEQTIDRSGRPAVIIYHLKELTE